MDAQNPQRRDRDYVQLLAKVALVVVSLWALFKLVALVGAILTPVLFSLLVAYLLDPVIDRVEARGLKRTPAILLVSALLLVFGVGFMAILLPALVSKVAEALTAFPTWAREAADRWQTIVTRLGISSEQIQSSLEGLSERAQTLIVTFATGSANAVASLLNLVLIPVFSFYFLRDFDEIKRMPLRLIPERHHARVVDRSQRMSDVVGEWVRGQIQVAGAMAVLYVVGLLIVGLDLAVPVGLLAGLLNVIPYLGLVVGLGLSLLLALMEGATGVIVGVLVVFAVVQVLEQYVITPRLVGDKVGMSAPVVLIVLLVCGALFGFYGILFGIPASAAGSILVREYLERYRQSPWFRRDSALLAPSGAPAAAVVDTPPPPPAKGE